MKAKIFTLSVLAMLFFSLSQSKAQNILYDGNFSSTTVINSYYDTPTPSNVWFAWQDYQINNSVTVADGVCSYQVINPGYNTYDVQLIQKGFPLTKEHSYRLSFDVKSDLDHSFGVFLGEDGGSWTNLIGYDRYLQYATTTWKTITLDFVTTAIFPNQKVSFELGAINATTSFDNIVLEDLGPYMPTIGIVGVFNDWSNDLDMQTTDGILYTITNYPLPSGDLKFRQNHDWSINWGSTDFPSGVGYQGGPNIPATSGNYDIAFNRLTGEYVFTCISNCIPSIGIIGTAVPPNFGAEPDVNLFTNDGITYTLKNYTFVNGDAKFRQDDSWNLNWGNSTFPTGTATLNGPNIPISSGTYNVDFNIITGNYNFATPIIGILGSALIGWETDIDMETADGINYTLNDLSFMDGEIKFRADNSWEVNWGGYNFPKGFAQINGPNIYIPSGTYKVTFNRITGEYSFTATTCPIPAIQCPWGAFAFSEPGTCGATVYYDAVVAAPNCGGEGVTIKQTEGLPSGSFFPMGNTINTFLITNAEGNTASCNFSVFVYGDPDPPIISGIADELPPIWPPNHKMVPIHLDYTVSNNCGGVINSYVYVYSNEPDNGLGDGDLATDWEIKDSHNILLRAERSGTGSGRIYYINIVSYDTANNYSFKVVTVQVPHDKGSTTVISYPKNASEIAGDLSENTLVTKVWPNPSTNAFNLEVQSTSNENVGFSIFDFNGNMILNLNASTKQATAFGKDLNPGIYLVQVRQGNHFNTLKIVKQ